MNEPQNQDKRAETRARALGQLLANSSVDELPAGWLESGALQLQEAMLESTSAGGSMQAGQFNRNAVGWGWLLKARMPMVAAAAVLSLVIVTVTFWPTPNLSYRVEGVPMTAPDRVEAPEANGARLRFSDGSVISVLPGSQVRVLALSSRGATVELESGEAQAEILHQENSHWKVKAGPFAIQVTGTRFYTRWNPGAQTVEVDLLQGAVEITGGGMVGPVKLEAGQRFRAVVRSSEWGVTSLGALANPSPSPSASSNLIPEPAPSTTLPLGGGGAMATGLGAEGGRRSAGTSRGAVEAGNPPLDWSKAMKAGQFAAIVADAEATGLEACLASCSPVRLRLLADAARYTQRLSLAERALLALRQRSPGEAASTTYLLGTLAEIRGQSGAARNWYQEYLQIAPQGTFATEAKARLGRLESGHRPPAGRSAHSP